MSPTLYERIRLEEMFSVLGIVQHKVSDALEDLDYRFMTRDFPSLPAMVDEAFMEGRRQNRVNRLFELFIAGHEHPHPEWFTKGEIEEARRIVHTVRTNPLTQCQEAQELIKELEEIGRSHWERFYRKQVEQREVAEKPEVRAERVKLRQKRELLESMVRQIYSTDASNDEEIDIAYSALERVKLLYGETKIASIPLEIGDALLRYVKKTPLHPQALHIKAIEIFSGIFHNMGDVEKRAILRRHVHTLLLSLIRNGENQTLIKISDCFNGYDFGESKYDLIRAGMYGLLKHPQATHGLLMVGCSLSGGPDRFAHYIRRLPETDREFSAEMVERWIEGIPSTIRY